MALFFVGQGATQTSANIIIIEINNDDSCSREIASLLAAADCQFAGSEVVCPTPDDLFRPDLFIPESGNIGFFIQDVRIYFDPLYGGYPRVKCVDGSSCIKFGIAAKMLDQAAYDMQMAEFQATLERNLELQSQGISAPLQLATPDIPTKIVPVGDNMDGMFFGRATSDFSLVTPQKIQECEG